MCAKKHATPRRHGGDHRGSAESRRRRKQRLLDEYGDGTTCQCVHCGCTLTFDTLEQDRRIPGGPYAYWNLQPSCSRDNKARSNDPHWTPELSLA